METTAIIGAALIVLCAVAFLYVVGRPFYYWVRAKLSGWTPQEKFDRETAWINRAAKRDQRLAERDAAASHNTERRRWGVGCADANKQALGRGYG
jgi:hypothetical protein